MNPSRKMWASAAAVGVIVAGGVSVAAAASAGRLDQLKQTRAVVEKRPPSPTSPSSAPSDGPVASVEVNPDPGEVAEYWTDERLQDAHPMPMPEVKPGEFEVAE